ncbi:unnamed protein product [Adineta steineri]|uniref:Nephrin-like protein n=1 Tax=Adineta steineri TaxID=433720 RepID=A0A818I4U8_9BILA|nr:unnamed protein product [Adineta steineri]CAF3516394.1 unnamed protein product [Adineta steineri]
MALSLLLQLFIFYSILYLSNSQGQFYEVKPHDISAAIGSNITIPCVIAPPHGDVQWTKDGLALGYDRQLPAFPSWSIIGDENRGEFNFFIESLKLDDEGVFACEVSPYNDAPALKQIAHVRTLVRPERIQINDRPPSNKTTVVTMRYDETIHQINCRVDGARPAAQIKWINGSGQEFPATIRTFTQGRLFSTVSTLALVPSLSLHKNRFTCDVRHETINNDTDKLQTSFDIEITSPPSIPTIRGYPSTYFLINGSRLTLSCQTRDGNPLGRLSWHRYDSGSDTSKLIDNSFVILNQQNATENNITMIISPSDNNATLSCNVINAYLYSLGQKLQTNLTLQVAFGPSSVQIRGNTPNTNTSVTTLTEGTTRQFTCRTTTSNPRPIVVWKLDGQILMGDVDPLEERGDYTGKIIQLVKTIGLDKPLREYHRKILSCEGRNPETGQVVVDATRLNIIYDATSIEMHGVTKEKIIKAGDKITAECILTGGNPLGKITWFKGDELLRSEYVSETNGKYALSRVEFIASSSDNNLPLICKGQVETFPERIASFSLNVVFLPTEMKIIDSTILSNLTVGNDSLGEFECRTSISNPQATLTIIRQSNDGIKHSDIPYKTSSTYLNGINSIKFMLPQIDLSLHGNLLTCEATLDIDTSPLTKQVTYVLNVNHKPHFHDFDAFADVKESQSFNITLEASAYPMPITYTWFHPSGRQLFNDQSKIFINQGQLSLISVQKSDLGVYRCVATNTYGSAEVNFTLNVLYGPVITRTRGYSVSEAAMPGSSVTLLCGIDANPVELNNVKWFKNNESLSSITNGVQWEKRIEGNEVSLIGKSIRRDDAGQYACEISNPYGNSRATIPLVIQYAPEIDRSDPSRYKAAADSDRLLTAELHCYISSVPRPTVTWLKNNEVLSSSSKYRSVLNERTDSTSSFSPNLLFDAVLYVTNITKSDHGVYQCKVENSLGTETTDITLTGLTIPDAPNQVRVTNTSHSSLLISWMPGFDGGARQTFQIRYRLSSDTRYSYEDVPFGEHKFDLKHLLLASEYYISLRSNNSHHLSIWTDEILASTSRYLPSSPFYSFSSPGSSTRFSLTVIVIVAVFGLFILLINIVLISLFIMKRRRTNVNSDNSSTTGTNETEANTVDIFQPIPSNLFFDRPYSSTTNAYPFNTYQRYEDDDAKRPFVPSYSSATLTRLAHNHNRLWPQEDVSSYLALDTSVRTKACSPYAAVKKGRFSPYDNVRLHPYSPSNLDSSLVTYRSFKDGIGSSSITHDCIRAELV